jgi:hypothetical protein
LERARFAGPFPFAAADDGFLVADVFDSEEAVDEFTDSLTPRSPTGTCCAPPP